MGRKSERVCLCASIRMCAGERERVVEGEWAYEYVHVCEQEGERERERENFQSGVQRAKDGLSEFESPTPPPISSQLREFLLGGKKWISKEEEEKLTFFVLLKNFVHFGSN